MKNNVEICNDFFLNQNLSKLVHMLIQTQQYSEDVFWPYDYKNFVAVLSDVTSPIPKTALCSSCILVL
jgi:hypothetical protein